MSEGSPPSTIAGYQILETIGRGGMGTVYKAVQPVLNRIVAFKTMAPQFSRDQEFVARFLREAALAANLSHPNIVQVYAAGECDDAHYIAMEFVDGESLRRRLDRKGPMAPSEALAVCVCVAQALNYAWEEEGLIHRDIKPENIFLSRRGDVKLGDLGLAKSASGAATEMTCAGMAMGSAHYMSPEQAKGSASVDFRSDIYGLGCTLYHMLTGRPPYDAPDMMSVMLKHVSDPPPEILKVWPTCPQPLARLLGRMLAKDQQNRHSSYDELVDELRDVHEHLRQLEQGSAAVRGLSGSDGGVSVQFPARKADHLIPAWAMAAIALLLAAGGAAFVMHRKGRKAPPQPPAAEPAAIQAPAAPTSEQKPAQVQDTAGPKAGDVLTITTGIETIFIPAGEFLTGITAEERAWVAQAFGAPADALAAEQEQRRMRVMTGFWLGRTEVTVGQWRQFVAETDYVSDAEKPASAIVPSPGKEAPPKVDGPQWRDPKLGSPVLDEHPVTCLSARDAAAFCAWLTKRERGLGRIPAPMVCRLPAEPEWESACRGGLKAKRFWWGDEPQEGRGRLNVAPALAMDEYPALAPVDAFGERGRNRFGLADMLGNAAELCTAGPLTAVRGGDFESPGWQARCASRVMLKDGASPRASTGFRVCIGVPDPKFVDEGARRGQAKTGAPTPPSPAPAQPAPEAAPASPPAAPPQEKTQSTSTGIELVFVPPGDFVQGSTPEERRWALSQGAKDLAESGEPRRVTMRYGFWLGRTEVTVAQWRRFTEATNHRTDAEKNGVADCLNDGKRITTQGRSWRDAIGGLALRDDHPVVCVSWNDASAFCTWLTERERTVGKLPDGMTYRLPTEAEWEYACRGGTELVKYWWGDAETDGAGRLNWGDDAAHASGVPADGFPLVAPVDSFGAKGRNGRGLADMLGNVSEWCLDVFDPTAAHETYYVARSDRRVHRGGWFQSSPAQVRIAARGSYTADWASYHMGFRLCCGPDPLAPPPGAEPAPTAPTPSAQAAPPSGPRPGFTLSATEVPVCSMIELHFPDTLKPANPYDPDEVAVDGIFLSPSGVRVQMPGFYLVPMEKKGEEYVPAGEPSWCVRFSPREPGAWKASIRITTQGRARETEAGGFNALPARARGFLRTAKGNPLALEFENGELFAPVGRTLDLRDRASGFERLVASGCNFGILHLGGLRLSLELAASAGSGYAGIGRYHPAMSWVVDRIVEAADRSGISLCLGLETGLAFYAYPTERESIRAVYLAANGGPLRDPDEFWTNADARKFYKRKLRYAVARWGASPAVGVWQLFDSMVSTTDSLSPEANTWHAEMAAACKALDPVHRPVGFGTLYFLDRPPWWRLWKTDPLDVASFGLWPSIAALDALEECTRTVAGQAAKPFLLGPIEPHPEARMFRSAARPVDFDPDGLAIHNAFWAAGMNGAAGILFRESSVAADRLACGQVAFRKFFSAAALNARPWSLVESAVTVSELPEAARWGRLEISAGYLDADPTQPRPKRLTIPREGAARGGDSLPARIDATPSGKTSFPEIAVDYPADGTFEVLFSDVTAPADSAPTFRIEIDGETVASKVFESGAAAPAALREGLSAPVKTGRHTIRLALEGARGIVDVGGIVLDPYADRSARLYRVLGMKSAGAAVIWVHNRENTPSMKLSKLSRGPAAPAIITVTGIPAGSYDVQWWDTWQGVPTRSERVLASSSGFVLKYPGTLADEACLISQQH